MQTFVSKIGNIQIKKRFLLGQRVDFGQSIDCLWLDPKEFQVPTSG